MQVLHIASVSEEVAADSILILGELPALQVLHIASVSEEVAADSILDTASVAIRTLKAVADYAKDHGLKVFKVTIEEIPESDLMGLRGEKR